MKGPISQREGEMAYIPCDLGMSYFLPAQAHLFFTDSLTPFTCTCTYSCILLDSKSARYLREQACTTTCALRRQKLLEAEHRAER